MKRLLILLLLCLWLPGCAARAGSPSLPEEDATIPTEPLSLYAPGSGPEAEYTGALKAFPVTHMDPTGLYRTEDALYLIGEMDGTTHIQRFTGENLTLTHSLALEVSLSPEDGFFQFLPDRIAYFDPMTLQVVVLDEFLQEQGRIMVREDMTGTPVLSADGATLYYCTRDGIRALELESGISRLLKEISSPYQTARALHQQDTLLECVLEEEDGSRRTLLLSTADGGLEYETGERLSLATREGRYYAHFSGGEEKLIFGTAGQAPRMLDPSCAGEFFTFLSESHGAFSARKEGDTLRLSCYDLSTGALTASAELPGFDLPTAATDGGNGNVWLLFANREEPVLFLWNTAGLSDGDGRNRTTAYLTPETTDPEGMAQCRLQAESLSETFGVDIRIPRDGLDALPEGWQAESAYHPQLLTRQLTLLEERLSSLPRQIPELFASRYSGLRICLVRSLTLSGERVSAACFWEGTTACILLGEQEDAAFYEALFGLMDTVIHTRSAAFDRWGDLNPMQFTYVGAEAVPEGYDAYLQPETRAFADKDSMTDAKTERCRLFAHAMAPEMEELFQSLTMQKKLSALCEGIREGFGLEKDTAVFPWEQYLKENT